MTSFVCRLLTVQVIFLMSWNASANGICEFVLTANPTKITALANEVSGALALENDPLYIAFQLNPNPVPDQSEAKIIELSTLLAKSQSINTAKIASTKIGELMRQRRHLNDSLSGHALIDRSVDDAIEDSIQAYRTLSVAQQYLQKRIEIVRRLLQIIPEFKKNSISRQDANSLTGKFSHLSNTVMSFRSNINWEKVSPDNRLRLALNQNMQYQLAQEYSTAANFEDAQAKSDYNGNIGGNAYGMVFDVYLRASLRENARLEGSLAFAQPRPWFAQNIDRIELNLRKTLTGLAEALKKANQAFE